MGFLQREVASSVERMFLAVFICGGVFILLYTAPQAHFTSILAFGAPIVATVVSFFFRLNADAQTKNDKKANDQAAKDQAKGE